jgi:hypothetical protein
MLSSSHSRQRLPARVHAACAWLLGFALLLPAAPSAAEHFVVFGDLQDASPAGRARDAELIDRINRLAPAFSVYVGDIKGGRGDCSDALYRRVRELFDAHAAPLVYTPGDNEWTDCWRGDAGAHDPVERKAAVVARFTAPGRSLGRAPMPLEQQQGQRENARWRWQDMVFATLHMTGSNNNLQQRDGAIAEHVEREAYNEAWLDSTFALAQQQARALVLFIHANPQWDARWWEPTGFDRFRARLAAFAQRFDGPVLVVHGDSHRFRIDKPLRGAPNVTRVEVFGPPQRGAVIIELDPGAPELMRFTPLLVDG